jgi:heme-binding HmuY-like protein
VIGIPLLLLSALAALFVWGQLQPRPEGFAVTATLDEAVAPATTEVPVIAEVEVTPASTQYTLDARDKVEWAFFDIDSGGLITSTFADSDWDLAFRRTKLLTNSGITNPDGAVGATDLGELDLETAVAPEAPLFVVDALGGDDGDDQRNAAISRWYNYDFIRHVIVARANVYLVRTSDGGEAVIQFDSYYCEDELPGCVTFRYRLLSDGTGDEQTAQR